MGIIGKEKRANEKLKASYYEKIVELIPIGLNSFGYMVSLYVILITQGVFQKKKKKNTKGVSLRCLSHLISGIRANDFKASVY